jgi:HD-GYP domain-containing protein (c-di-GMP phosphodiesterase class II)
MRDAVWDDSDPIAELHVEQARLRRARVPIGRERVTAVGVAAAFFAAAVPLAAFAHTSRSPSIVSSAVLVLLFAAFSRIEFEVASVTVVPSELALVPMLALLPAKAIPLYVAAGLIGAHLPDYVRGGVKLEQIAQLVGNAWFSFGPALVILAAGEPHARLGTLPIFVAALAAQFACDALATITRQRLAIKLPPRTLLRPMTWAFMVDALLFPIGFLAAWAAEGQALAPVLTAPLAVLLGVFSRDHAASIDRTLELSNAYRGTALLLGDVVEADDAYTGSHSRDVVAFALAVCDRLGLDARDRRKAEFTALLHDVGKIRIPDSIINKPGPLTPAERDVINTHAAAGQELLERVGGLLGEVGALVRSCHEHYDGHGYPDGLAGEEIPLVSRIVCCCDAFSAMTTDRSYRSAMTLSEAIAELARCSGSQFDPVVAQALIAVVRETSSH